MSKSVTQIRESPGKEGHQSRSPTPKYNGSHVFRNRSEAIAFSLRKTDEPKEHKPTGLQSLFSEQPSADRRRSQTSSPKSSQVSLEMESPRLRAGTVGSQASQARIVARDAKYGQSTGDHNIKKDATLDISYLYYMDIFHCVVALPTVHLMFIYSVMYILVVIIFALLYLAASHNCGESKEDFNTFSHA
eukprot:348637_1